MTDLEAAWIWSWTRTPEQWCSCTWPGASQRLPSPGGVGEAFFETLDLEAELLEEGKRTAIFLLPACAVQYEVLLERDILWINSTGMSAAGQDSPKAAG